MQCRNGIISILVTLLLFSAMGCSGIKNTFNRDESLNPSGYTDPEDMAYIFFSVEHRERLRILANERAEAFRTIPRGPYKPIGGHLYLERIHHPELSLTLYYRENEATITLTSPDTGSDHEGKPVTHGFMVPRTTLDWTTLSIPRSRGSFRIPIHRTFTFNQENNVIYLGRLIIIEEKTIDGDRTTSLERQFVTDRKFHLKIADSTGADLKDIESRYNRSLPGVRLFWPGGTEIPLRHRFQPIGEENMIIEEEDS